MPHLKERMESGSGSSDWDSGGFRQFTGTINRYLIIKTWISLGTGVTLGSLFFFVGVDYALLWGIVAFILNYIPNIGSIVAAVPPVALAFFQFGTTWGIIVLVICVLVNLLFANIMEPRFLGRGLRLSPVIILFSLVTWGWVFGATGIFLAVPLTVTVRLLLEKREETHWIAVLLGKPDASAPTPDEQLALS